MSPLPERVRQRILELARQGAPPGTAFRKAMREQKSRDRYASRILRYWRRKFPSTCQGKNPDVLLAAATEAADGAIDARTVARLQGEFEHVARVAAVDVWAVPPNPGSGELVNGVGELLRHRWRRLWFDDYEDLNRDQWWAGDFGQGLDALMKTVEFVQEYRGGELPWREVIARALDEHGSLPKYVGQFEESEPQERHRQGTRLALPPCERISDDVGSWLLNSAHRREARVRDISHTLTGNMTQRHADARVLKLTTPRGVAAFVYRATSGNYYRVPAYLEYRHFNGWSLANLFQQSADREEERERVERARRLVTPTVLPASRMWQTWWVVAIIIGLHEVVSWLNVSSLNAWRGSWPLLTRESIWFDVFPLLCLVFACGLVGLAIPRRRD